MTAAFGMARPYRASSVALLPQPETTMTDASAVHARQREIATEHLLFKLMEYVEARQPGLLDFMDGSIDHLGDPASDETKDDDAVREIARRMIRSARKESAN